MLGGLRTSGQYSAAHQSAPHLHRTRREPGFTVVEMMVVLAVSGMLLLSAMVLISGKQNQVAFNQSIRQIESQIRQRINEVATGYYENTGNIRCNGGGTTLTITAASGTEQGANAGCIFLGKALQFQAGTSDPERFNVFSIAGIQKGAPGGLETTTLAQARPKVISPSLTESTIPDAVDNQILQNGLSTYRMWYNNGGTDRQIGAVAFTMSLAQYDSTGAIASGSQQVDVVPIDDGNTVSRLGQSKEAMAGAINSRLGAAAPPINPTNGVFICFASGTTNQSGLITIGNNNRQLSVKLDIKGNKTCS